MISVFLREQKRYTQEELVNAFECSEAKTVHILKRLKEYGVLKAVKAKSMMLYSLISDSMAYLDTDTVTVKTNSMAILMISSNDEMLQLLTNEICKTLGYTVNVLLAEK